MTWIEINSLALAFNLNQIRSAAGDEAIISPCVKANAYGHGLVETGKILMASGANWLSVNSLEEARQLRFGGLTCPILVIGLIDKKNLGEVLDLDLRIFLYDLERADILNRLGKAKVHIKIDTGMHRQGVLAEKALDFVKHLSRLENLEIEGLATHFATSDEPDRPQYYQQQLEKFKNTVQEIEGFLNRKLITHCDKTASLFLNHEEKFSLVRPGLATYGYFPNAQTRQICESLGFELKPALSFKTKVGFLKDIPEGSLVGYGCTYTTTRPTRIALLPLGYCDGFDRKLSNQGYVLIHGHRAPVLGRVCMNLTIVDVSDIYGVEMDDEVVIIGSQGDLTIRADELAQMAQTVNYEILARLREGITRYYI